MKGAQVVNGPVFYELSIVFIRLNDPETGIIPVSVKLVIEQFFREIGTTGSIALQSFRRTRWLSTGQVPILWHSLWDHCIPCTHNTLKNISTY